MVIIFLNSRPACRSAIFAARHRSAIQVQVGVGQKEAATVLNDGRWLLGWWWTLRPGNANLGHFRFESL
jgi:hypothetical protein